MCGNAPIDWRKRALDAERRLADIRKALLVGGD